MWHDMFTFQIPAAEKIIRTVLVYLLILVLLRVSGRRSMAQLSTMDLTVMFLLSNVVQNAIIGNDNSLVGGALGAVVLVAGNELIDYLCYRRPALRKLLQGRTVEVIRHGSPIEPELRRLGLRESDLNRMVRIQNGNSVDEVAHGRMDPDGHLEIKLRRRFQGATANDIDQLEARLARIEQLLTAQMGAGAGKSDVLAGLPGAGAAGGAAASGEGAVGGVR
ncbi:DUF421 domain-containing protein [Nakamurella aerolata]|uniref:DUF421 domain-containing protein n=1 Tax=Nakamurella aerolata TaxID=1656892 RepID=UPI001BB18EE6|nr:DUF421 domain-containing protein [Nakamurella aerolata]